MTLHRLIHISDIHLSRQRAYTYANWQAALHYIDAVRPDLVVNTGDLVLDSPEDVDDLIFAYSEMQRVPVPWMVLPGDHDIGGSPPQPSLRPDVPWLERYMVTQERIDRYLEIAGYDCWAMPFGSWYLIGINTLLAESGLPAEAQQWDYLQQQLVQAAGRPVALFMHKPPCIAALDEVGDVTTAMPDRGRRRLHQLITKYPVHLIASGHRHVYRTYHTHGITIVNAPTLMCDADGSWATDGIYRNGLVEYTFNGNSVEFRLVEPPGMRPIAMPPGGRSGWPKLPVEELDDG